MPTDFPMGAFVLLGSSGTPPNEVFHYSVRYERTEVIAGIEQHARYTADVVFTFRPDLKISGADALANPARMQVESFSTIKDRALKRLLLLGSLLSTPRLRAGYLHASRRRSADPHLRLQPDAALCGQRADRLPGQPDLRRC